MWNWTVFCEYWIGFVALLQYYLNVATCMKYNSKNEVIHCAEENNNILLVTPQTKNADDNGTSSVTKVDAVDFHTNWLEMFYSSAHLLCV